jgi:glycerol-3-phosphate dehydrogenase
VLYYDGQFDDARLLINLAQTADEHGAVLLNYAQVKSLSRGEDGFIDGLSFVDLETNQNYSICAHAVINATGAFSDSVRKLDEPDAPPMIAPSQGVHIVLDRAFLPGESAIMVPRTSDGRVMFAIPWHGHTLVGTTDTPIAEVSLEPVAMESEIDFILETASQYLSKAPTRADILSVFAGIRPLVKASESSSTAALARDHSIHVSESGLITIAGGKWTTYRKMAEDCVDHAITLAKLEERDCVTRTLRIHGYHEDVEQFGPLSYYGSDAPAIARLGESEGVSIDDACVIWAARYEMARTVDDVLSRRSRLLQLDAREAVKRAERTATLMAKELHRGTAWPLREVAEFSNTAAGYIIAAEQ